MGFRHGVVGVVLASVLGVALVEAQQGQNAQGRSAFRALNAQQAAGFRVPDDMRLVGRTRLGTAAQIVAERYRQFVGEAEVLGGQLTVYRDATGLRSSVVGAHFPNLNPTNSVRITPGAAQAVAAGRDGGAGGAWRSDLMIDPGTGRYFYRVEQRDFDRRWFYWVDAGTGVVVNEYDGLTTGSGTGVLGDTKDLTGLTTAAGGNHRLVSTDGRQTTYDARNKNQLPGTLATDNDDFWTTGGRMSPGQPALVDAQFYANETDDYYQAWHGFDWLGHYSQGMVSSAHARRNYSNAYWNGDQVVYGDGDGVSFLELSGDLDVVAHELTHGVTDATSNLIYQNESGALNEAFSDIMATAVEWRSGGGNWTIGEDVTPGDNGIRNMANPGEDGDPSHYDDRYQGTADNGGVHINSGIVNHWFYLLVNGGQNAEPQYRSGTGVTGIGLGPAEAIAFLGFTALPATADFCDARDGTIAVAGSDAAAVADAWDEVGVDETLCSDGGGGPPPPPPGSLTISDVGSQQLGGTRFAITWTTNLPADSWVIFECCGPYYDAEAVTSHRMNFRGSVGATYVYYVQSYAGGEMAQAGPFVHQN